MSVEEGLEARDAANVLWAGNRDRLLPGERPHTTYSEDAEHWVRVYTDLVGFNLKMMHQIGQRVASVPVSENGAEHPDLVLLRAHVRRLRWRLRFWEERLAELRPEN